MEKLLNPKITWELVYFELTLTFKTALFFVCGKNISMFCVESGILELPQMLIVSKDELLGYSWMIS